MYFNCTKLGIKHILLILFILISINSASARVGISDFFSDFTSSDATITSDQYFQGKAVFELLYEGNSVESHDVPISVKAGESAYRVVMWHMKPAHDYYTAKISLYNDSKLLDSKTYQVSYGTVSLPTFHVVDFSPTNSGVQLLLRPFNPSAVDIIIELIDNNDIVYTEKKEDISLIASTEISTLWPFLLTKNKEYIARAKIFSHRLYASPLVNTYVSYFTATDDVEILRDDVQVDEYGASVTVRGKSQVPFDGSIVVKAINRATNETKIYSAQLEDILVSGKEDTAGVVWKGLGPGTYDVEITAVNHENATIDKYETVLRIPKSPATTVPPAKATPGFAAFLLIVMLLAARRLRGGRSQTSGETQVR